MRQRTIRASPPVNKDSPGQLGRLLPPAGQAALREAKTTYHEFEAVTTQVVKLSRQNSNVKSFELSLGRICKVTAECDAILLSLQEADRARTFDATK